MTLTSEQTQTPDHPATFSKAILDRLRSMLAVERDRVGAIAVLDPFAGVGGVHELAEENVHTYGVELQPEWAAAHERTVCMSVLDFPKSWDGELFDAIVTSPCYGNRMADSHDAQDKCRLCDGEGALPSSDPAPSVQCPKCKGSGLTLRNTYTHALQRSGVKPVERDDNAAVMQWGARYRDFHERAWRACDSVLRPGGLLLLNVKNHVRSQRGVEVVQRVVEFHLNSWLRLSYTIEEARPIETRGLAYGANSDVRTPHELIIALRKPS